MSRLRRSWRWQATWTQVEAAEQQVNLDDRKSLRPEVRLWKPGKAPPNRKDVDVRAGEVPGTKRRSGLDRQVARGEC